jgi:hypothetical protein
MLVNESPLVVLLLDDCSVLVLAPLLLTHLTLTLTLTLTLLLCRKIPKKGHSILFHSILFYAGACRPLHYRHAPAD